MKIAIIGVGAIGATLAAALEQAGHTLLMCTRSPLVSRTVHMGTDEVVLKGSNITSPEHAERVDWVLVVTKTYQAEATAKWFAHLCGGDTRVAICQNGVEHRERFAQSLAPEKIVPVVIQHPAEKTADGSVLQRARVKLDVANDANGQAFASLFAGSDARINLTDDFPTAAWRKLCINCAGALCAMKLQPIGVFHDEGVAETARGMVRECMAVGRAVGANLPDNMPDEVIAGYRAGNPQTVISILADRRAGREMEVDARNGVIVRLGRQHGIATPLNAAAVDMLK